jgi:hypothetical protein
MQIDPELARPLVYETLLRDLLNGKWYPQNVVQNLDEILPLLTSREPLHEVWYEVEQHVFALFASSPMEDGNMEELSKRAEDDTATSALIDLVLSHLNHPVGKLARAAQRIVGKALIEQNPAVCERVGILLDGSEHDQESLLNILDAVSWRELGVLAPFQERLVKQAQSMNYGIRSTAQGLCQCLGLQIPSSPYIALPAVYRLALPPDIAGQFIDEEVHSLEKWLLEAGDPFDLTRQFQYRLTQIAEVAGLPEENLFHCTAQIVRQLILQGEGLPYSEKQLRKRLEAMALRFPYQKPAVAVVHQAMLHLVAELLDAQVLDERDLRSLEPILMIKDPSLLLVEPSVKPSYIPSIRRMGYDQGCYQEWLAQTRQQENMSCHVVPNGLVVLGAETKLKQLDARTAVEIHQEVVCPVATRLSRKGGTSASCFRETLCRTSRYTHLTVDSAAMPLVLRHLSLGFYTPGEDWLALNPDIGRRCGWKSVKEGLFRWVDANGQTMVESLWWNDGDFLSSRRYSGEQVGEGWLVLASQDAFIHLGRQYGPLKRLLVLKRSYQEEDHEQRHASVSREMAL